MPEMTGPGAVPVVDTRADTCAETGARTPASLRRVVAAGLFATPAAAAWIGGDCLAALDRPRPARLLRVAGLVATVALAAAVLLGSMRWVWSAVLWALFCVAATAAIAGWLRAAGAVASTPRLPHEGRAREAIRAIAAVVFIMPPLVLFARLIGAAATGWALVRVDPSAAGPEGIFTALAWGFFWGVPIGAAFVVLSQRRGHLGTPADLGRAALAFAAVLILIEVGVSISAGALRTMMIGADLGSSLTSIQDLLLRSILYVAAVPLSLGLAWGRGGGPRRIAATVVLLAAGIVNLMLALGYAPRVQFVVGRQLEKSGRIEAALRWYGRSLTGRSTPLIESYLQHRIGLIDYKLGRPEQAAASFRLVQTTRNANDELVRQSAYYLEQLSRETGGGGAAQGRRVVLEGVEVRTEMRDSYCAPNTLALVLNYWDRPLSPAAIGEKVALIGGGTPLSGIRFLLQESGLEHWVVPFATIADLRWLVDRGLPVLVYIPGHVLAVFGYDTRLGTLVTYDTATWDIWVDEPLPDFLESWGKTNFMMGVVLPREGGPPAAAEVLSRFGGRSSEAAWHWWLSYEMPAERAAAQLRASLAADPGFFPAAFDILERFPSDRAWLREHADGAAIVARAGSFLRREHAGSSLEEGLARWFFLNRDWDALLEFADRLEQARRLEPARREAGVAAARKGRWERAAYLLTEENTNNDGEAMLYLAMAQRKTGQKEAAVSTAGQIISGNADDVLEPALEIVEEIGRGRGPAFLADVYERFLHDRPFDVAGQIRLAELSLEALSGGDRRDPARRLHRARLAARTAEALAEKPADRARAADLARRLEALRVPADGDAGDAGDEESP